MIEKNLNIGIEERLERVRNLAKTENVKGPKVMALELALLMAKELSEKKAPGTDSSKLVLEWTKEYAENEIEEAVAFAREFLLNPASIAKKIEEQIQPGEDLEE